MPTAHPDNVADFIRNAASGAFVSALFEELMPDLGTLGDTLEELRTRHAHDLDREYKTTGGSENISLRQLVRQHSDVTSAIERILDKSQPRLAPQEAARVLLHLHKHALDMVEVLPRIAPGHRTLAEVNAVIVGATALLAIEEAFEAGQRSRWASPIPARTKSHRR